MVSVKRPLDSHSIAKIAPCRQLVLQSVRRGKNIAGDGCPRSSRNGHKIAKDRFPVVHPRPAAPVFAPNPAVKFRTIRLKTFGEPAHVRAGTDRRCCALPARRDAAADLDGPVASANNANDGSCARPSSIPGSRQPLVLRGAARSGRPAPPDSGRCVRSGGVDRAAGRACDAVWTAASGSRRR